MSRYDDNSELTKLEELVEDQNELLDGIGRQLWEIKMAVSVLVVIVGVSALRWFGWF